MYSFCINFLIVGFSNTHTLLFLTCVLNRLLVFVETDLEVLRFIDQSVAILRSGNLLSHVNGLTGGRGAPCGATLAPIRLSLIPSTTTLLVEKKHLAFLKSSVNIY